MLTETFDLLNGGEIDMKKFGLFLKAVANDVYKEELDIITEKNLERQVINPMINEVAKVWFFKRIEL